jgi:cytochrome oxidase Cu insertion factor (SCO1/SenC/PrrC family)
MLARAKSMMKGGDRLLRRTLHGVLSLVLVSLLVVPALAQEKTQQQRRRRPRREVVHPKVGEAIPNFTLEDIDGKEVNLTDFRNKIFVLELGACT